MNTDNYSYEDIDFSSFATTICDPVAKTNGLDYDKMTNEYYRVLRKRKLDPVLQYELEEQYAFAFPYKWDPYTGERSTELDEYGPIYFDPDVLIKHFHSQRLRKLWNESDKNYEGHYDDAVGIGEDFYLTSRGNHPEWYLFRLPILDCYLTKDHNQQYITMGPILTNAELIEIEHKAHLNHYHYYELFGTSRPSLSNIKKFYTNSISKIPSSEDLGLGTELPCEEDKKQEIYEKLNRYAVDQLRKIRG